MDKNVFNSKTYGSLTLSEVVFHIASFLNVENSKGYRIIIGTDSKPHNLDHTDYISAIVVHRVGCGAIYFWERIIERRTYSLKERIYREAILSLELANNLISKFKDVSLLTWPLEIHVDIGNVGETREVINEVVGMIRGSGFAVKTKPESYGASTVADRHT